MVGITRLGVTSYNGYQFDGATKLKVRDEFFYDEADRVQLCHRLTVNICGTLSGVSTDDVEQQMDDVRFRLSQPGKALVIDNRGFGNRLAINLSSGGLQDLQFGPKPRMLSWEPVGGSRSVDFEWECETSIPVCNSQGVYQKHTGVMSMCYDVDYEINERGFTTRTITGYLSIVSNRSDSVVLDAADRYRELLQPKVLRGFRRRSKWTNDNTRTRVNFSIVDAQIESKAPFPQHVTDAEGEHRVHWSRSNHGAMIARNTITMKVTLVPLAPQVIGYKIFGSFVKSRVDAAARAKHNVLIDDLEINENIFGFDTTYSCSYRVLTSLRDILTASQVWQIPSEYQWDEWHRSMGRVQDVRGLAGLIYQPAMDVLVSPCGGAKETLVTEAVKPFEITGNLTQPYRTFQNPIPTSQNSWMEWQNQVTPERRMPVVRQAVMQNPEPPQTFFDPNGTRFNFPAPTGTPDTMVSVGVGRYSVTMVGYAERAQFPIPRPLLVSVGGQKAVEEKTKFACRCVGNYFGVPVYRAAWRVEYKIAASPGGVDTLGNLQQGVNPDGKLKDGS